MWTVVRINGGLAALWMRAGTGIKGIAESADQLVKSTLESVLCGRRAWLLAERKPGPHGHVTGMAACDWWRGSGGGSVVIAVTIFGTPTPCGWWWWRSTAAVARCGGDGNGAGGDDQVGAAGSGRGGGVGGATRCTRLRWTDGALSGSSRSTCCEMAFPRDDRKKDGG